MISELDEVGNEQITLATRRSPISRIRPRSPSPALLEMITRSRQPRSSTASSRSWGAPAAPKPLDMMVTPSAMPASAASKSGTRLSIIHIQPDTNCIKSPAHPVPLPYGALICG